MDIYIIRHGRTNWNEKKIIQGHSQNRLSKSGVEMVKKTSKASKDIPFEIIYTSPLMRAKQTAKIMNEFHSVEIIEDRRLIEVGEGVFTKRHQKSMSDEEKYAQNVRLAGYGMESWQEVRDRAEDMVNWLKTCCPYRCVLLVTHDLPATCYEEVLLNKSATYENREYIKDFENAEIRHYVI